MALSGGVDSAVSALLLKQRGYDVTGVFMKNWSGEEFGIADECPWQKDQNDAQAVCKALGIPFKTYNFEKEYRAEVIENFFSEYKRGNTPNPDLLCNQKIKFGRFLDKALSEGADMIATGHYAQRRDNPDGSVDLIRAVDQNKDQTYFLSKLNQQQLSKALFPIGHLTKDEVRKVAAENKLPVAEKKDSQGICFIGKIDVVEFLQKVIKPRKGDIVDADTQKKVGEHNGVWYFTLGQREGIGVGGTGEPYFVSGKDVEKNILYVAKGRNNPLLYQTEVNFTNEAWINENNVPEEGEHVLAMIRYRQTPKPCTYHKGKVVFDEPVWLSSPGQTIAFFRNEILLGSANL